MRKKLNTISIIIIVTLAITPIIAKPSIRKCDEVFLFWCLDRERGEIFRRRVIDPNEEPSIGNPNSPSDGSGGLGGGSSDPGIDGPPPTPGVPSDGPGRSETAPGKNKDASGHTDTPRGSGHFR